MIEEALFNFGQQGFGYFVAVFLLWKGYKQDERYIRALERIEQALALLEKNIDKLQK